MKNLLIRLLVNACAVWLASEVVRGMQIIGGIGSLLIVALIFGLVNALIRPIVMLLSLPAVVLTIGLFTLVINALMLWLTSAFTHRLIITGFVPAFLGALIISIVSAVLSWALKDNRRRNA